MHGEAKVSRIQLRDTVTGQERDLDVTGLFVAIGHDPPGRPLQGSGHAERGPLRRRLRALLADKPVGVYACGDVMDHEYIQAITAAGSGCMAALDAERYLAALADVEGGIGSGALADAAEQRAEAVPY